MIYSRLPRLYITKSTIVTLLGGGTVFIGYEIASGAEEFHKQALAVARDYIDGETGHRYAVLMAKYGIMPLWGDNKKEYDTLKTTVFGREFKNPVGLAAGFDKDGEAIPALRKSGFGFIEIGSVTPRPQPGNPKPRVFRLDKDEAVINRYGFNSQGVGPVSIRVKDSLDSSNSVPLGVNLGKNKDTVDAEGDYEIGVHQFGQFCDYLVVNVSSPNTPGLRDLQGKDNLEKLLSTTKKTIELEKQLSGKQPLLMLKISPDLDLRSKRNIARIVTNKKYGVDGLIISNTTVSRPFFLLTGNRGEVGGLSGRPLKQLSTQVIGEMYYLTDGKIPIIGVGGISSGEDAYEKIRAGASLVQLYTAIVYQGFPVIGRVKRELDVCLRRDGFKNVSEAVGFDHKK
uniref:Dihydroorotate dehydrogenase (quinone), mitochondrial n=1 Tax=Panagrolaimus sp. PS1159 TaxID=55785 RepID=A0AC35FRM4_9BILA